MGARPGCCPCRCCWRHVWGAAGQVSLLAVGQLYTARCELGERIESFREFVCHAVKQRALGVWATAPTAGARRCGVQRLQVQPPSMQHSPRCWWASQPSRSEGGMRRLHHSCAAVRVMHAWLQGGSTPLCIAAKHGHVEAVNALLAAGANKDGAWPVGNCVRRRGRESLRLRTQPARQHACIHAVGLCAHGAWMRGGHVGARPSAAPAAAAGALYGAQQASSSSWQWASWTLHWCVCVCVWHAVKSRGP